MSNKSHRIKYDIDNPIDHLKVKIERDFDFLEVLSVKIAQEDAYKLYASDYGVVVGRVIANDGFGIPNAKVSIFIKNQDIKLNNDKNLFYPYTSVESKNSSGIRYNLLPSEKVNNCHQNVGTFHGKRTLLDNDVLIEVFDSYYKYTTVTNESGDYMLFGVPVGQQQIHVDIDLSDIGVLSQAPRDMIYKGFGLKQFDSPNKFKKSTNLNSLTQILSEDTTVFVYPFWGDQTQDEIAISKKNINIQYKFEPTCVFMGSIFTDSMKSYISKSCKPSKTSGKMSELMASQGSIEMIRESVNGEIEVFNLNGTRLIDNNGVWCYQIPMNLDYVITDEYGNLVPTTDPTRGIPTRAKVRFRITLDDSGTEYTQSKTGAYLIPNNPQSESEEDYEFNENTKSQSFVNLMWNNVYSVKNYIPRIQKGNRTSTRSFLGLKSTNYHESNNPAPYNNIWVDMNLRFIFICFISVFAIKLAGWVNTIISNLSNTAFGFVFRGVQYVIVETQVVGDNCGLLENYDYVVFHNANLENNTADYGEDAKANTYNANTGKTIYFERSGTTLNTTAAAIDCIETTLSVDNEVVNFDLTNDWINGSLYAPRFTLKVKRGRDGKVKKLKYCGSKDDYFNLQVVQSCAPIIDSNNNLVTTGLTNPNLLCDDLHDCYKQGASMSIDSGLIKRDIVNDIYYYKSNYFDNINIFLQPTDIILLGSLNENDMNGIPQLHRSLSSTSFKLPPDLVDSETGTGSTIETIIKPPGIENANVKYDTYQDMIDAGNGNEEFLYYVRHTGILYKWDGTYVALSPEELEPLTTTDTIERTGVTITNVEMSGIDWGNPDITGTTHYENGLFVSIKCLNSDTIVKTCINASRICEIGVDFDEQYDYSNESGVLIEKFVDGYISTDEISDGDVRSMFSTLNINNLSVNSDIYNHLKYEFIYNEPYSFDGRLKAAGDDLGVPMNNDVISQDYNRFRLSETPVYYVENQFPRFNNSFYFYFGIKAGSTALDIFNNQYFVPCGDIDELPFSLSLLLLNNESICVGNDGTINITVTDIVYPYDIYVNDILYSSDINYNSLNITGLTAGYKNIKIVSNNGESVSKTMLMSKIENAITFDYEIGCSSGYYDSDGYISISNLMNGNSNKIPELNEYYYNVQGGSGYFTGDTYIFTGLSRNYGETTLTIYEKECLINNEIVNGIYIPSIPQLTNTTPEVTQTGVTLNTTITENGGSNITEKGFYVSTGETPTVNDLVLTDTSNENYISTVLTINPVLNINTTYYYRAYAVNDCDISLGDIGSFLTPPTDIRTPIVVTFTEISATTTTLNLKGGVDYFGLSADSIVSVGVYYSTGTSASDFFEITSNEYAPNYAPYYTLISGLTPNTTYYYKSFATNEDGFTGYGLIETGTTLPDVNMIPIIVINNIEYDSVSGQTVVYSQITDARGPLSGITAYGVELSDIPLEFESGDGIVYSGISIDGSFTLTVDNDLRENNFRAHATNDNGIGYSNVYYLPI